MKRKLTDYFYKNLSGKVPESSREDPSNPKRPNLGSSTDTSTELQVAEEISNKTNQIQIYDIGSAIGKNLDDQQKLKFLSEPWKPPVNYCYPKKVEGKQNRKFNGEWLEQYNWLAYSEQLSGGFCKMCVLFAPTGAGIGSQELKTFVKEPLSRFKKATEEFKRHESAQYHKFSLEKALLFKESLKQAPENHIGLLIDQKRAAIIEKNRKSLAPIVKTVLFCAQNNLPLRGHRDDGKLSDIEEQDRALKGEQGVFRSLLAFRMDAGDENLKQHLATCKANSTMISKTIQNEIIDCVGEYFRIEITKSIKKSKYFSIICDETTDISRKELTFCVRYINMDRFTTEEDFLGFVELKSTTSVAIKAAIDEEMKKLGLSYRHLCGQGYDGGSNMAGHLRGCQALVAKEQPLAIFTHCFSHSLNLCISKSCEVPMVRNMMGTVESVSVFLSASAHRTNALMDVIEKLDSESRKRRLKALCPTRWVERHDSLITFQELLIPIVTVLEELSLGKNAEASTKAYMMLSAIKRSEFVIGLNVAVFFLSLTLRLSQALQSPKQDLSSALKYVNNVLNMMKDARSEAEVEFSKIFENSNQVAEELGFEISTPRVCKRQTKRDNVPASSSEDYYRRSIFIPLVDHFIGEIEARFSRDFQGILPLEGLIPANLSKFADEEILDAAWKYEPFLDELGSRNVVMAEIKTWRRKWKEESHPPSSVMETLKRLDTSFFPSLGAVLQVFGTIPVTTSSAERSFSTLKRLKNYLRSTMGESRLNGLALANISKHRVDNTSVEKIVNLFSQTKNRRMCLENWGEDCD